MAWLPQLISLDVVIRSLVSRKWGCNFYCVISIHNWYFGTFLVKINYNKTFFNYSNVTLKIKASQFICNSRLMRKKSSKFHTTGPIKQEIHQPLGGFPAENTRNAESVSKSWCHHAILFELSVENSDCITGPSCKESTSHQWIPSPKGPAISSTEGQ